NATGGPLSVPARDAVKRLALSDRQPDADGGPTAERALHRDASPVRRDDAVADGEAEPRAAANVLGREEGIEDVAEGIGLDPGPVVRVRRVDTGADQASA